MDGRFYVAADVVIVADVDDGGGGGGRGVEEEGGEVGGGDAGDGGDVVGAHTFFTFFGYGMVGACVWLWRSAVRLERSFGAGQS